MIGRLQIIDAARGLALIAMAIYHCTWDLSMFGYISQEAFFASGWTLFARSIASSFLFLVGFSLILSQGFAASRFWWRFGQVACAAAVITIATYVTMPNAYIFFGILHIIALSMILGSLCITAPWYLLAGAAVFVFFARDHVTTDLFSTPWATFIGLSGRPVNSVDFVPLFPWFSAVLLGMAAGRFIVARKWIVLLATVQSPLLKPFATLGRYSLIFYLVHQPIMISLLYGVRLIFPPSL